MKTENENDRERFPWLRAVRDRITRDTEGMTPEERVAYTNARSLEARKRFPKFTPEEAKRELLAILYDEEGEPTPTRRARAKINTVIGPRKAKAVAKAPSRRRKAEKRLAHA